MLDHTALAENNIVNEVDRYLALPGQALAYKIGQLEIRRLRAEAEARARRAPSTSATFHDVVLGEARSGSRRSAASSAIGSAQPDAAAARRRDSVSRRRLQVANPLGECVEDRVLHRLVLLHQRPEPRSGQDEERGRPDRRRGGRARPIVDQGDLAEEVAGPHRPEGCAGAIDADRPADDHEELRCRGRPRG